MSSTLVILFVNTLSFILFTSPLNTFPGPISIKSLVSFSIMNSTVSLHLTGENICFKSEPYFDKNSDTNMQIIVKSAREKIIYEWTTGDLIKNGYKISNNLIPFQSDRTNKILISLLNGEKPEIATLEKAIRIHYILLDVLEPSWHSFVDINKNKKLGLNKNNMLIT